MNPFNAYIRLSRYPRFKMYLIQIPASIELMVIVGTIICRTMVKHSSPLLVLSYLLFVDDFVALVLWQFE